MVCTICIPNFLNIGSFDVYAKQQMRRNILLYSRAISFNYFFLLKVFGFLQLNDVSETALSLCAEKNQIRNHASLS